MKKQSKRSNQEVQEIMDILNTLGIDTGVATETKIEDDCSFPIIKDRGKDLCFTFNQTENSSMPLPVICNADSFIPGEMINNYERYPASLPNASELTTEQCSYRIHYMNNFLRSRISQLLTQAICATIGAVETYLAPLIPKFNAVLYRDAASIFLSKNYLDYKNHIIISVVDNSYKPTLYIYNNIANNYDDGGVRFVYPLMKFDDAQFCEAQSFVGSMVYTNIIEIYSKMFSAFPQDLLLMVANNAAVSFAYYFESVVKQIGYEITVLENAFSSCPEFNKNDTSCHNYCSREQCGGRIGPNF